MNWITPEMLATVGGAALAVTLVTMVLKAIWPTVTGRSTQLVAFLVALVISVVIGTWTSPGTALASLLNAVVVWTTAMGIDQAVTYKQTPVDGG